jgi:hypothetical protein
MKVIEDCPICNTKLEPIPDEEDFIIDWFCSKCCISWDLEDLEYEPIQKDLTLFV